MAAAIVETIVRADLPALWLEKLRRPFLAEGLGTDLASRSARSDIRLQPSQPLRLHLPGWLGPVPLIARPFRGAGPLKGMGCGYEQLKQR